MSHEFEDIPPDDIRPRQHTDPQNAPPSQRGSIIAHHLILHAYGHWLPNDPRGSGSNALRADKLTHLGPIHKGRKPVQPPKEQLREFYKDANPKLDFPIIWFTDAKRQALADTFAQTIAQNDFKVYACAILSNHAHLCIRRHRDSALAVWTTFADDSRKTLRALPEVPNNHPIWSTRPYKQFLRTPTDVQRTVHYIEQNPMKERLPPQPWPFIQPYDNWPHHQKSPKK
jgi:REP element-mobilizing transposase RayT